MHIFTHPTAIKRSRSRQALVLVALIVVATLLVALDMTGRRVWAPAGKQPIAIARSYGIAMGDTLASSSHGQRLKLLKSIRGAGFTEVRFDLDWNTIQPVSSQMYSWKTADSIMQDVAGSHLSAIVTLDRTPTWAREPNCKADIFCAPASSAQFARFAAAAVQRYQNRPVTAWEIWNEPNITNFWKPQPNAPAYAALLSAAYHAIKQQTPAATVLAGGLAGNALDSNGTGYIDPRTYLQSLYQHGAGHSFDGVAYHPYTGLRLPSTASVYNGWLKMSQTNPSLRSIMADNGDSAKGIWLTEFGLPTSGSQTPASLTASAQPRAANHVTPADQAQVAQAALADVQHDPWIKSFDWYTYADNQLDPGSAGGSFGLIQADGAPKPAYYTFKNFLR